jgi:hypothetical protein
MESAAYPKALRIIAAVLLADIVLFGLWLSPQLLQADWSAAGLALFAGTTLMVVWMGSWIVRSRTRLEGDALSQTWIWNKHARAADAASVKLVDIPGLRRIIAPRLLVRLRGGGIAWFHSADPQLLITFCGLVVQRQMGGASKAE